MPFESYTSQEQFVFLMSTSDTEVLMLLMHFIEICLQIRAPVLREIIKMYFSPTRDELITFHCFIIFLKVVMIDLCLCLSCSLQS